MRGPREIRITPWGLYVARRFVPFTDEIFHLERVRWDPAHHELVFTRAFVNTRQPIHVMVPPGAENEAANLADRFRLEVVPKQEQMRAQLAGLRIPDLTAQGALTQKLTPQQTQLSLPQQAQPRADVEIHIAHVLPRPAV